MDYRDFLAWEATSRDTIDFKKVYVDMAEDLVAGLMLSQIIFYNLPGQSSESKLRVQKGGHTWLVKKHSDWYDECRITERQSPRALQILADKGLVETKVYRFNGSPTIHIRVLWENFLESLNTLVSRVYTENVVSKPRKAQFPKHTKCNIQTTESVDSLTENTTKTTADNKGRTGAKAPSKHAVEGESPKGRGGIEDILAGLPHLFHDQVARLPELRAMKGGKNNVNVFLLALTMRKGGKALDLGNRAHTKDIPLVAKMVNELEALTGGDGAREYLSILAGVGDVADPVTYMSGIIQARKRAPVLDQQPARPLQDEINRRSDERLERFKAERGNPFQDIIDLADQ